MPGTRKLGKTTAQRKAMLRQQVTDFLDKGRMETTVTLTIEEGGTDMAKNRGSSGTPASAGITVYMCEDEHYDAELTLTSTGIQAQLKLNIGGIKHVHAVHFPKAGTDTGQAGLMIRSEHEKYDFYVKFSTDEEPVFLGSGRTKYLSSEVSGGFTGTMIGLYAIGNCTAAFTDFTCRYDA